MTERGMKLTDEELVAAQESVCGPFADSPRYGSLVSLRAVQDAVLAKAEVETRERERAAAEFVYMQGGGAGTFRTFASALTPATPPSASPPR